MPTVYSHYMFGKKVLNKLHKNNQEEINKSINYYNMFNQGWDNLYYYLWHWKYYRNFGIKAHHQKIDIFFKNMFDYIKENNLQNNSDITSMVYGFINHYTLDTIVHPYINYQVNNLNIPHTKLEYMIDYYLYNLYNNSKWQTKIYKELIPRLKYNNYLTNFIDDIFYKTYKEKNMGKIFKKSHNTGYYIYRYFIHDLYGIKTKFYKLVDLLPIKNDIKFSENSFYIKTFDERILNKENKEWYHPKRTKEKYNYSLKELFDMSLELSIILHNKAYKIIHNNDDYDEFLNLITKIDLQNIEELLQ